MIPNLFDAIDEQLAEQMIEQHDRYEFGRVSVQRIDRRWFVYYGAVEAHCAIDPQAKPTPFVFLAHALEYALSPANLEAWEEVEQCKLEAARCRSQSSRS